MNWDALGAISELVSAAAIVVTLAFLIVQIRHNSATIRNSTIQDSRISFTSILGGLVNNTELFDVYYRGMRNQLEPNSQDRQRFDVLMLQMFRMVDAEYQQFQDSASTPTHWGSIERILRSMISMPGILDSWKRQHTLLSENFTQEVNSWRIS